MKKVVKSVLKLTGALEGVNKQLNDYLSDFDRLSRHLDMHADMHALTPLVPHRYRFLWADDKNVAYHAFMKTNPDLEAFEHELKKYGP